MRVLRPPSRPPSYAESVRLGTDQPPSLVTLGKTIIALYLATLMAAMISAKVLPEGELDRPEAHSTEASTPPPIILDS